MAFNFNMLNIGIIGFGKMGQLRASAIDATGRARVVIVHDPFHKGESPYATAASPEEIINDPRLGAVVICTPNHRNRELTILAMRAGKHVLCEKPPAFTAVEVAEIQEVEKSTGRKLMYGFNHRHHQSIKDMKGMIDSGAFGRVLWMRGRYGKSVDHNYFETWRARKELAGGGILLDQGIHMLDLFLHLGGSFDEVQAMVSSLYWNLPEIEDNVFLNLRNRETGLVASLHSTMTQWRHLFSLEVFLERGYMVINGIKTQSGSYGDEILTIAKNRSTAPAATWEDEEKRTYHVDNSWADETASFIHSVLDDVPVINGNSMHALQVMKIIDEVYTKERHFAKVLHSKLQA